MLVQRIKVKTAKADGTTVTLGIHHDTVRCHHDEDLVPILQKGS